MAYERPNRVIAHDVFSPATWKQLTAFVQIVPQGDILPARAKYGTESLARRC